MILSSEILLSLFLISLVLGEQACENNATLIPNENFCSCSDGFIGKDCSLPAFEINNTGKNIILTDNFTFAYYEPEQKIIYRILLSFCSLNKDQDISIQLFAQEQQKNGDIYLIPKKDRDILDVSLPKQSCRQLMSAVLISTDKKPNQQLLRIIFGFRLVGSSSQLKDIQIVVKCQTNSIFTISFLGTVLTAFLVIIVVLLILSLIFLIRKKCVERRSQQRQNIRKIECINNLMPSKKYSELMEQRINSTQHDLICSICLCQFEKSEDVRKTPCGHIYHADCLDSWCNSNLNCPICRQSFENEQELRQIQESLRQDQTNIRQPIL